jgi:hypothetical protein
VRYVPQGDVRYVPQQYVEARQVASTSDDVRAAKARQEWWQRLGK